MRAAWVERQLNDELLFSVSAPVSARAVPVVPSSPCSVPFASTVTPIGPVTLTVPYPERIEPTPETVMGLLVQGGGVDLDDPVVRQNLGQAKLSPLPKPYPHTRSSLEDLRQAEEHLFNLSRCI